MSKQHYFSTYKSPNIRIVPSASICYPPSPKRPKVEIPVRDNSPQNIDVSFLDDFDIDEIVNCLNDCDDNAQNTARQKGTENNNNILQNGCAKSSINIANNNERSELISSNIEKNVSTNTMDSEEIKIDIEITHKNMNTNITCIEKSEAFSNKYIVHKDEGNQEIFAPSQIIKQPNDETYNTTNNSLPDNVNSRHSITNYMENKTENNNTDEIREKRIQKCALKTKQDLAYTSKAPKPFDGDGKTETKIECNTTMKNVNKIKYCEEYSEDSDLQNKHITTHILDVETKITRFNTNETKQNKLFKNSHAVSKNVESENLKNIDCSQTIKKNENRAQKAIDSKQVVLFKSDEPKSEKLIINNLEKIMFEYLNKKYFMFSLIHSGTYSNILKCKDLEEKHYAVKIIKKKGNGYRKENMWSSIQSDIPKENLLCVNLIAGFSLNKNWCYLTDFYPKNLKDLLKESKKNLHIDIIQKLAGQLVGAVTTLRNKNIVHSDINPGHILLDSTNNKLRLCGFDRAYYIEAANLFPYKGTKCYRAPEVILGYSAGFSLDVWSTALVLHEMATGMQLFGGCIADYVLYKQICILGEIPPQMLLRSRYKHKYINGYCLRNGHNSTVKGRNKIANTIKGAYFSHWTEGKNQKQISKDMEKIHEFTRLLEKMLVIYPERRLPIEFAYSNPFIYEVFNK